MKKFKISIIMKVIMVVTGSLLLVLPGSVFADNGLVPLSDQELDAVYAKGFYFHLDLALDIMSDNTNIPAIQINLGNFLGGGGGSDSGSNGGSDYVIPSYRGPVGGIFLGGNAQSGLQSLVNVIGAGAVINVGLNIMAILNSPDCVFNNFSISNMNTGALCKNFTMNFGL